MEEERIRGQGREEYIARMYTKVLFLFVLQKIHFLSPRLQEVAMSTGTDQSQCYNML